MKMNIQDFIFKYDVPLKQSIYFKEDEPKNEETVSIHKIEKIDQKKLGYDEGQKIMVLKGTRNKVKKGIVLCEQKKEWFQCFIEYRESNWLKKDILYYSNNFYDQYKQFQEIKVIIYDYKIYEDQKTKLEVGMCQLKNLNQQDSENIFKETYNKQQKNLYLSLDQQNEKKSENFHSNLFILLYRDLINNDLKKKLFKHIKSQNLLAIMISRAIFYKISVCNDNQSERQPPLIHINQYNEKNLDIVIFTNDSKIKQSLSEEDKKYIKDIEQFEKELCIFVKQIITKISSWNILLLTKKGLDFEKYFGLQGEENNKNITQIQISNKDSQELEELLKPLQNNTIVVFTQIEQIFKEQGNKGLSKNNLKSFLKYLKSISQKKQICFIFTTNSDDYEEVQYEFDQVENLRQFDNNNLQQFQKKFLNESQLEYQDLKSIQYLFIENDISRIINNIKPLQLLLKQQKIEKQKFLKILKKKLNTSDKFETEVPKLTWDNIGGIQNVKQELIESFKFDNKSKIKKQKGILLFGPPGTGKTLLAKCIANEFNSSFIAVKGPELLDKYVGESEKNLRQVFNKANNCIPCVLFFDELDSLLPKRGNSQDSSQVTDRMVSQFLAELENSDQNLFLIAATNRPDLLDAAILSSGKFDKKIYMGIMNSKEQRIKIIESLTKDINLHQNCSPKQIEKVCPSNITGADFYGIVMNSIQVRISKKKQQIMKKSAKSSLEIQNFIKEMPKKDIQLILEIEDFNESLKNFTPSLSNQEIQNYENLRKQYADLEIK